MGRTICTKCKSENASPPCIATGKPCVEVERLLPAILSRGISWGRKRDRKREHMGQLGRLMSLRRRGGQPFDPTAGIERRREAIARLRAGLDVSPLVGFDRDVAEAYFWLGMSTRAIALSHQVSRKTIYRHLKKIKSVLGVAKTVKSLN